MLSTPTNEKISTAKPDMTAWPEPRPDTFQFCWNRAGSKSNQPAAPVITTEIKSRVTVMDTTLVIRPTPRRDKTTNSQIKAITVRPRTMGWFRAGTNIAK